jgi:GT2 family glycosyltransferase
MEALQGQTHPVAEIIVVDNASTDGTAAMVRADFPEVTLRVLEENRGGAGGFHEGMKLAAARDVEWIWVMDDDAEPNSDALEQLFSSGHHRKEETAGLASLRVNPDGTVQKGSVGWYAPFRMTYDRVAETENGVEEIGYATFVGLMVRAQAVRDVGLPDADFFIRCDDNEYVLRLSNWGPVYLVWDSHVVHHDASQSKQLPTTLWARFWGERPVENYWRRYYLLRNQLLIVRKHAENRRQRWGGIAVGLYHFLRSVAAVLCLDNNKWLRITVLARAFWHGITGRSGKYYDPEQFSSSHGFSRPRG